MTKRKVLEVQEIREVVTIEQVAMLSLCTQSRAEAILKKLGIKGFISGNIKYYAKSDVALASACIKRVRLERERLELEYTKIFYDKMKEQK